MEELLPRIDVHTVDGQTPAPPFRNPGMNNGFPGFPGGAGLCALTVLGDLKVLFLD